MNEDNYDELDFEELMVELEKITNKLENDSSKISLDEAVKLFENGILISKKCNEKLDLAEKKITMLINSDGELREENFIPKE